MRQAEPTVLHRWCKTCCVGMFVLCLAAVGQQNRLCVYCNMRMLEGGACIDQPESGKDFQVKKLFYVFVVIQFFLAGFA